MSRATWEVSIDAWPHQLTVWCPEDGIDDAVRAKLVKKYDFTKAEAEFVEVLDTINLTEANRSDDKVGEDYDDLTGADA